MNKAYKLTTVEAIKDIGKEATRLETMRVFLLEHEGSEVAIRDYDGDICQQIREYNHAYYIAHELGGFIICCDENYEGNAIEVYGDYCLDMDYKGLIHEPSDLLEHYTQEDIDESYYPYNGGELYIDMPIILEQIY